MSSNGDIYHKYGKIKFKEYRKKNCLDNKKHFKHKTFCRCKLNDAVRKQKKRERERSESSNAMQYWHTNHY